MTEPKFGFKFIGHGERAKIKPYQNTKEVVVGIVQASYEAGRGEKSPARVDEKRIHFVEEPEHGEYFVQVGVVNSVDVGVFVKKLEPNTILDTHMLGEARDLDSEGLTELLKKAGGVELTE